MKLILSKKGFDTKYGKIPSPIFPNGDMVSFPIGQKESEIFYKDIKSHNGFNLGELISFLTSKRNREAYKNGYKAHLDPDIYRDSLEKRPVGWKPALGQGGRSLNHLENQKIGEGDLFLFYGWFREIEETDTGYIFKGKSKNVIWGYLQVDEIKTVKDLYEDEKNGRYKWLWSHVHLRGLEPNPSKKELNHNSIFIAKEKLDILGINEDLPGAAIFKKYHPLLNLSDLDSPYLLDWQLPSFFYPSNGKKPLTYNIDINKYKLVDSNKYVKLRRASIGQEFVLDCEEYKPEVIEWLKSILLSQKKEA